MHYNILIGNRIGNSGSSRERRIDRIKNEQHMTGCFSYVTYIEWFERLLSITSDCQYVMCNSIFISMKCEDLKLQL